jgi:hypothetical protein
MRPKEYKMPEFLDPEKRLQLEQSQNLHNVMIKLALLMRKYRVMPKAYFKDAVRNRKSDLFANLLGPS